MACLIKSQETLAHEVIGGGGLVQVEGDQGSGATHDEMEGEGELDAAHGLTQADGIAAHALGDDDALVEIPALGVGGEEEHESGIVAHAAQAFAATQHEPHIRRLERDLAFLRIEIIASNVSYTLELDTFDPGNEVLPAETVDSDSRNLGADRESDQATYKDTQEDISHHSYGLSRKVRVYAADDN